ncbi:hypothetical protein ACFQDN_07990 [Pseudomonas asuensis]|jgi:hypothetical protein|uniref:Roadblock/LC7 domain-containing protein n=1 Tax=Pseudomonas asuensis TaxID=1825787 RepID=A0ABQ2GVH7_9PSED|nr:hypothetical protein [Pseudomonas asuensis]GGM15213.1 hypothetical protein GCM10009425_27640 [Pseudomonas asuensis]
MANIEQSLSELLNLDGALAAALVDHSSGMLLGSVGSGVDLELAAGGNTEVIRAKYKTMKMLGLDDSIEDILITLTKQYHLIRPLSNSNDLFVYYVLDRSRANLALARRKLQAVEGILEV